MRALRLISLLATTTVVLGYSWTLHDSCFENETRKSGIIKSFKEAKRWALNALAKFDSPENKDAIAGLTGGKFNVKSQIRDRLEWFNEIEDDPVGAPKYWQSPEWAALAKSDDHWTNFVVVCVPDLITGTYEPDDPARTPKTYNKVRQTYSDPGGLFEEWVKDNNDPALKWADLREDKELISAATVKDTVHPDPRSKDPTIRGRTRVPQTINFYPLLVKHFDEHGYEGWEQWQLDSVTEPHAVQVFKEHSEKMKTDIRPIDALMAESFTYVVLHEMMHLSALGEAIDIDDGANAYGWADNEKAQDPTNADLYAIIGLVVELSSRKGKRYLVDQDGKVTQDGENK